MVKNKIIGKRKNTYRLKELKVNSKIPIHSYFIGSQIEIRVNQDFHSILYDRIFTELKGGDNNEKQKF